jgi:hypothetical protein
MIVHYIDSRGQQAGVRTVASVAESAINRAFRKRPPRVGTMVLVQSDDGEQLGAWWVLSPDGGHRSAVRKNPRKKKPLAAPKKPAIEAILGVCKRQPQIGHGLYDGCDCKGWRPLSPEKQRQQRSCKANPKRRKAKKARKAKKRARKKARKANPTASRLGWLAKRENLYIDEVNKLRAEIKSLGLRNQKFGSRKERLKDTLRFLASTRAELKRAAK